MVDWRRPDASRLISGVALTPAVIPVYGVRRLFGAAFFMKGSPSLCYFL